jgi:hypothetical protein
VVDGSERHQRMDGFGVEIDPARWNAEELAPTLDRLVDDLGAALFRVRVDAGDWDAANDGDRSWRSLEYLNRKGVTSGILLALEGPLPARLGGTRLDVFADDAWVEWVASLVRRAKLDRGLQFGALSALEEPDGSGRLGPRVDETRAARLLHRLAQRLEADDLRDVRLVGPRLAFTRNALQRYIPRLLADPLLRARLGAFALRPDGRPGPLPALVGPPTRGCPSVWRAAAPPMLRLR